VPQLRTFDFSNMYTNIPLQDLISRINKLVSYVARYQQEHTLKGNGQPCMSLVSGEKCAIWERALRSKHTDTVHVFTVKEIHELVRFVVMNTFIKNGSKIRRQVRGIPMGTNCAPLLANLYLYSYESDWIQKMSTTNLQQARGFHLSFRYIDDLLSLDNPAVDML